jgi:hypothetical protein
LESFKKIHNHFRSYRFLQNDTILRTILQKVNALTAKQQETTKNAQAKRPLIKQGAFVCFDTVNINQM